MRESIKSNCLREPMNWKRAALAALLALLAQGCNVGPHYRAPAPPTVTTYTPPPQPQQTVSSAGPGSASIAQQFSSSAEIPAEWWTLFHSPELNAMVSKAFQNSPTLAQATARLKQAQQELAARTGQTKYPTVTGSASVQQEQLNLSAYGIPFPTHRRLRCSMAPSQSPMRSISSAAIVTSSKASRRSASISSGSLKERVSFSPETS